MSLENEDHCSSAKAPEMLCESQRPSRMSYTREFLLSFSELDSCKKLPVGFDQSILSEFEDAFHGIQDRPRLHGSVPFQGFRRSEYSSSPPTRGDSGSYSRGTYARWDSRSSGRTDRDSDSQSDRDSDSTRRYGHQARRSWQSSEHDGLLGSGSFPRPQGYVAGMSGPNVRANDRYQLNRSNEPYHPPRPYKAVPHARKDTDSCNDETFGSGEYTSQDREEEERRRASFELMRKEQQKVLQEKQKSNLDKRKDDSADVMSLLDDTKAEKKLFDKHSVSDASVVLPMSNDDSGKTSFTSQSLASRPLVPPGFANTNLERNPGAKSFIHTSPTEVGKPEIGHNLSHAKANLLPNEIYANEVGILLAPEIGLIEQQTDDTSILEPLPNKVEKLVNSSSVLDVFDKKLGDSVLNLTSSHPEAHEALGNGEVIGFHGKKVTTDKTIGDTIHDNSTSILEKLFGSASTVNVGSSAGIIEHRDGKQDDTKGSSSVHSSKFAHWFSEDEKKPMDGRSSCRPSDLLSLIVGSEKTGPQVSDVKAEHHFPPQVPCPSTEFPDMVITSNIPSTSSGISEQLYNCVTVKPEVVSEVFTCEDLEQTILSEYSEKSSTFQPPVQSWNHSSLTNGQPKADIDDSASQHLLSLLQKGLGQKAFTLSPTKDTGSSENLHGSEIASFGSIVDKPRDVDAENIQNSARALTLETLFGTAFMKELQSVEAPVSVQRGSSGSGRIDDPQNLSFSSIDKTTALTSNYRQQNNVEKIESWLGFHEPQVEVDPRKLQNEIEYAHGVHNEAADIQLPEEGSLISVADTVNPQNSMFMPSGNSSRGDFLSSNPPVGIAEKLAALNAAMKDEQRSMIGHEGRRFARGPYDIMEPEIPYHKLHGQPSSPQFHPPHLNHGKPVFHQFDPQNPHINPQMNSIIHHDAPPSHQFPPNAIHPPFHRPSVGLTGFDHPTHPMLKQMQISGNFPPPRLLHEFPRDGAMLPRSSSNRGPGFIQEQNHMQGYPFGHRPPSIGGMGTPMSAPDLSNGGGHPEAFQRLIEMEMRAKAKKMNPMYGGGHELDMGFQYR